MWDIDWKKHRTDLYTAIVKWAFGVPILMVLGVLFKWWEAGVLYWWTTAGIVVILVLLLLFPYIYHVVAQRRNEKDDDAPIPLPTPPPSPRTISRPSEPHASSNQKRTLPPWVATVNKDTPQQTAFLRIPLEGQYLKTFKCMVEVQCDYIRLGVRMQKVNAPLFQQTTILGPDDSTLFVLLKDVGSKTLKSLFYLGDRPIHSDNYVMELKDQPKQIVTRPTIRQVVENAEPKKKSFTLEIWEQPSRPNHIHCQVNGNDIYVTKVHPDQREQVTLIMYGDTGNYYHAIFSDIEYTIGPNTYDEDNGNA